MKNEEIEYFFVNICVIIVVVSIFIVLLFEPFTEGCTICNIVDNIFKLLGCDI